MPKSSISASKPTSSGPSMPRGVVSDRPALSVLGVVILFSQIDTATSRCQMKSFTCAKRPQAQSGGSQVLVASRLLVSSEPICATYDHPNPGTGSRTTRCQMPRRSAGVNPTARLAAPSNPSSTTGRPVADGASRTSCADGASWPIASGWLASRDGDGRRDDDSALAQIYRRVRLFM